MDLDLLPDNPYKLLTPGPLSTTKSVKAAMLRDWCTWDDDYNQLVQEVRQRLLDIAAKKSADYTTVLMQGSGTFAVESVIGSVLPPAGKLLVMANGAYGRRIAQIAKVLGIPQAVHDSGEVLPPDLAQLEQTLKTDSAITHVAVVHCETTTGILNPIREIGQVVKKYGKVYIVDAMSSFGGVELDVAALGIDFLISSANKCIQGVPGFGFIVARTAALLETKGQARSLSLDLFDQWDTMEKGKGKWRYTSPTHVVRAFHQALLELEAEGGVQARQARYRENQATLAKGMPPLGYRLLLPIELQSPIITAFHYPDKDFQFRPFYDKLKAHGFVIYPGKVSEVDTFRIGNIGDVTPSDMNRLLQAIAAVQG
jgi:2-aminoethylphosphonate-pyruvate transaminase